MTFTDKAIKQLIKIRPTIQAVLRVRVIGGGCSGMSYKMEWEEEYGFDGDDVVFEKNSLLYAIDGKSYLFLKGTDVDFEDGLNGQGWVYNNPNASRTCGCGSSFS